MKDVVIVESPTKANTIGKYLGNQFEVLSSKGHLLDLPQNELGVDIENDFNPTFVQQNKKLIGKLRNKAKNGDQVYLATDNDREGEAIAYDLYQLLGNGDSESNLNSEKFQRVIFNEITKNTIKQAIQEPISINLNKVDAQRARRILDRLVGYLVSPLLSKSISGSRFEGLSAGRVQSVALRFIVDREQEREEFQPEEYWEIVIELTKDRGRSFPMDLTQIEGDKPEIGSEQEAQAIEDTLESATFTVNNIKKYEKKRSPLPPFITSSLQRAASSVLNYSPSRTMRIAQQLYEGIDLPEGTEGLITYMRTDSTRVAKKAQQQVRKYIQDQFGEDYLEDETRYFRKNSDAQDAHEAIRPTNVTRKPGLIKSSLTENQYKLYKLIWDRFVATQMKSARYLRRKVTVTARSYQFKTSTSDLLFDGFLKVLNLKPLSDQEVDIPENLSEGDELTLQDVIPSQHFTKPPNRYSEAGLIKKLEKRGIGRPSTYASIIHTIQTRDYVYKDGGSFVPTLLGFITIRFLKEFFSQTVEPDLTAEMESALDEIIEDNATRNSVLNQFYQPLKEKLDAVEEVLDSDSNGFEVSTDVSCPECGSPMNIRYWKGSPYLSCSDWPDCEETVNLPDDLNFKFRSGKVVIADELEKKQEEEEKLSGKTCPKCGSEMEIKHGRYGRFYACTNSDCDETASISSGVICPRCEEAELVERYSRRKKQTFYGCSNYPDCKFTVGKMPQKRCPNCDSGVLIKNSNEEKLVCSNKECNYEQQLD